MVISTSDGDEKSKVTPLLLLLLLLLSSSVAREGASRGIINSFLERERAHLLSPYRVTIIIISLFVGVDSECLVESR